jgi:hypothetical protein
MVPPKGAPLPPALRDAGFGAILRHAGIGFADFGSERIEALLEPFGLALGGAGLGADLGFQVGLDEFVGDAGRKRRRSDVKVIPST